MQGVLGWTLPLIAVVVVVVIVVFVVVIVTSKQVILFTQGGRIHFGNVLFPSAASHTVPSSV